MDLSNSETTSCEKLMKYYSNNVSFRSKYRRQTFPFRDTIIRYITQNPSSAKVYQKMIQSCKHFFIKNPIIIVQELYSGTKGWYTQKSRSWKNHPNDRYVDLNELTSKIWITDSLVVCGRCTPNWLVIYQCDAKSIVIHDQILSFNDLMVIASKCEKLFLSNVVIMKNDDIVPETEEDAVSLEALLKALPNVKSFTYHLRENSLNIITSKTVEELLKIPHFLSLNIFQITEIPEIFDIETFYCHIKENKKTKTELYFSDQISDEFKIRLQTIVDEILETKNRDYKVPYFGFSGMTRSSHDKMCALCRQI
uniref:DUF38 domain-containing protein n=1 Tax=Panagrolaimus davidi TaxID=227884 RepID=A0A914PTR1_9BILA